MIRNNEIHTDSTHTHAHTVAGIKAARVSKRKKYRKSIFILATTSCPVPSENSKESRRVMRTRARQPLGVHPLM